MEHRVSRPGAEPAPPKSFAAKILLTVIFLVLASSLTAAGQSTSTQAPVISPGSGTYHAAQSVVLTDSTPNATIYYTLDGTTPSTSSSLYSGPIAISQNAVLNAIAVANSSSSLVATAKYTMPAATICYRPAPGTYLTSQSVALSSYTAGAAIYYTTDGSTPTIGSNLYTGPLTVSSTKTITAIAVVAGMTNSFPSSAAYSIAPPAAAPSFSLGTGQYTSVQSVSLSDATPGAAIFYTTNGSTPTSASPLYTGPIPVAATQTIQAVALVSGGTPSPIASATYTIVLPTAAPLISPASGTYSAGQSVILADSTPNAVIYYTVNGAVPTTASSVYSGPISVSSNSTIQAMALASGDSASPVATANYTFPAAMPIIVPAPGTYLSTQTVSISSPTPGAAIYFTTNGATATTASSPYTGPFTVSSNQTIQAIAVASGYNSSVPAVATYTITPPAAAPIFSVAPGQYTSVQSVVPSDATPGAAIYFTTNGSTPTSASTPYSGPISVGVTQTIQAVALASGGSLSPVSAAAYTITLPAE